MAQGDLPARIKVGTDLVCADGERLVIYAARPMDWPVREFSRLPICVQGRKYYVRLKAQAAPPYAMRYELWPWPDDFHEVFHRAVIYNEDYVKARNETASKARRAGFFYPLLLPFYPLLGRVQRSRFAQGGI